MGCKFIRLLTVFVLLMFVQIRNPADYNSLLYKANIPPRYDQNAWAGAGDTGTGWWPVLVLLLLPGLLSFLPFSKIVVLRTDH